MRTRFTDLVGCRLPVVQTGMCWVSGARLTAATSASGGFGILGAVTMTADGLRTAVREVAERTDAPFGVNLRADQPDLAQRVADAVAAGVRLVSFAGAPSGDVVDRCHDAGVLVMPTVGARRHAEKVLGLGVDAVIAQGAEGGGHTGSVPTSLLLPQVVDAVGGEIPVLAAGGFADGRGLVAALAYGADGIAMGTRFLLTAESRVPEAVKDRYLRATVTDTVVTSAIDGAPQRVIATDVVERITRSPSLLRLPRALAAERRFRAETGASRRALVREGVAMHRNQGLSWAQVALAAQAPMLIKAALVDGHDGVGILPAGQVVGLIGEVPTVADVLATIEADAERTLAVLRAR
ncbi:MAG: nitronate monooxygenase [Actinobacteria bacterium]|nr:nitronate monooxygenase [Actinomycetota bacterium]